MGFGKSLPFATETTTARFCFECETVPATHYFFEYAKLGYRNTSVIYYYGFTLHLIKLQ